MSNVKRYELKKFDKPIQKNVYKLESDDVVTFQYGDYGNWVTVMVNDYKLINSEKGKVMELTVEDMCGQQFKAYDIVYSDNDYLIRVVGKASKLEKTKLQDQGRSM